MRLIGAIKPLLKILRANRVEKTLIQDNYLITKGLNVKLHFFLDVHVEPQVKLSIHSSFLQDF